MAVHLRVVQGARTEKLSIGPGRFLVGRAADCDLRVSDVRLAEYHAEITRSRETLIVRDLGSRLGTYVNHRRVYGPWVLSPGEHIVVGDVVLEAFVVASVTNKVRHPPVDGVHQALLRLDARDSAVEELEEWLEVSHRV